VIRRLMDNPRFGDAMLKFNLEYLERGQNRLFGQQAGGVGYAPVLVQYPNAVRAAMEARSSAAEDRYFDELFNPQPQSVVLPTPEAGAIVNFDGFRKGTQARPIFGPSQ